MTDDLVRAVSWGFTLPVVWAITRLIVFKLESRLTGRGKQIYKKFIFVWVEKEHYRLIVPIVLFSIGYVFAYYLIYRSSALIVLEFFLILQLTAALRNKDKTTTILNAVNLIIFFWVIGGGFADINFPYLHNWEFFKHDLPPINYPRDFFVVMIAIGFVFLFCIGLFVKPEEMLDSPTLTPLENEKLQEHLEKNKQNPDINSTARES